MSPRRGGVTMSLPVTVLSFSVRTQQRKRAELFAIGGLKAMKSEEAK